MAISKDELWAAMREPATKHVCVKCKYFVYGGGFEQDKCYVRPGQVGATARFASCSKWKWNGVK